MSEQKWKPDFKKWYEVDLSSYEIIYKEAKERFEEVSSESESITKKSFQLIGVCIAVAGFFFKVFIDSDISISGNWGLLIPFLIPISIFIFLIFPKNVFMRGNPPKEFIPKELDSEDNKGYQQQIIYYHSITQLQRNISAMNIRNSNRASLYKYGIILTVIMFLVFMASHTILSTTAFGSCCRSASVYFNILFWHNV